MPIFHLDTTKDSDETNKLLMCSDFYGDVTDFEVCRFTRNTKI